MTANPSRSGQPSQHGRRAGPGLLPARLVSLVVVVLITAGYYVVPVEQGQGLNWAFPVGFAAGLIALAWLLFRFVRQARTVGARVGQLLALAYLTVVFFAHAYLVVEGGSPEQFANLATRTDALYLSVTVVTTVGFGDVHAAGQVARGLVTVQMLFDALVLGVAVTQIRALLHPGR